MTSFFDIDTHARMRYNKNSVRLCVREKYR